MGHPPSAMWLPTNDPPLAAAVERVIAAHGGSPAELAALLRGRPVGAPRAGQLAALAWVLDAADQHVLLVLHPVFGWSCPGGHVERGEAPAATARELGEETGLSLAPLSADPVTLSRDEAPADDAGPAHIHWVLGYRFLGDRAAPLATEEGRPAAWFPIRALPADAIGDLAPLLARLVDPGTPAPSGAG